MEFFIRKDSIEPILKMQLVQDGRNDFQHFHDKLSNSSIYFSMKDEKTGRFEGQFIIYFHDDNTELIAPIREDLFINISESFVKSPCN